MTVFIVHDLGRKISVFDTGLSATNYVMLEIYGYLERRRKGAYDPEAWEAEFHDLVRKQNFSAAIALVNDNSPYHFILASYPVQTVKM